MSILLDALKKSEQERQLGQTPTLRTGVDEQAGVRAPIKPLIPIFMAVLSVTLIGWFGWQQFREPGAESLANPTVDTRMESISPAADEGAVAVAEAKPEAKNEAETEAGAKPGRTLTEIYGLRRKKTANSESEVAKNNASHRSELSQSVSRFTAEKDKPDADAQVQSSPPASSESVANTSGASPSAATDREKKRKSLAPHVAEPISYWELPQGVRDDLPEIKITVLVFAEQPKDRFLLSNGQRVVEKDQLGGGLVLDEIRKDGAVFLYRKYRFLVKG